MNVNKQMIDDLFKVITSTLDAIAIVDEGATTLTKQQLAVDVLAKTMDSLKADIELYFLSSGDSVQEVSQEAAQVVVEKAEAIKANAVNAKGEGFEKIWMIASPILNLVEDAAKANLPKDSTAVHAIITSVDAVSALGNQLAKDLPKLQA